jgi:hypothetical protein
LGCRKNPNLHFVSDSCSDIISLPNAARLASKKTLASFQEFARRVPRFQPRRFRRDSLEIIGSVGEAIGSLPLIQLAAGQIIPDVPPVFS